MIKNVYDYVLPYISVSIAGNCSKTYDDNTMFITSPDNSLRKIVCSWLITVPKYKTINLRFVNLNLEASVNCEISSLQIFDGPNSDSTIFGNRLCGQKLPDNIESTGKNLFVLFNKTSKSINANEFKIKVNEKGMRENNELVSRMKNK